MHDYKQSKYYCKNNSVLATASQVSCVHSFAYQTSFLKVEEFTLVKSRVVTAQSRLPTRHF